MANFLKGFKNILSGSGAASKAVATTAAKNYQADRAAIKAGVRYADIGKAPNNFNASGFLPKASK